MGAWSFEDLWSFEPELQRYPALIREIAKATHEPLLLSARVKCNKDLPDGPCTTGAPTFVFQDQSAPPFYLQTAHGTPKEKGEYSNSIISHTIGKIPFSSLLTFQSTTHISLWNQYENGTNGHLQWIVEHCDVILSFYQSGVIPHKNGTPIIHSTPWSAAGTTVGRTCNLPQSKKRFSIQIMITKR